MSIQGTANRLFNVLLCTAFLALLCHGTGSKSPIAWHSCDHYSGVQHCNSRSPNVTTDRAKDSLLFKRSSSRSDSPEPLAAALRSLTALPYCPSASSVQPIGGEAIHQLSGLHLWPFPRPPSLVSV